MCYQVSVSDKTESLLSNRLKRTVVCEATKVSMVGFVSTQHVTDVIADVLKLHNVPLSHVFKFSRCLVARTLYYSSSYTRQSKRNSSIVAYIDTTASLCVGNVLHFISSGNCAFAVIQPFRVMASCQSFFNIPHNALDCAVARILPVCSTSDLHVCNVLNINQKCVAVKVASQLYVCIPPNVLIHD